VAPNLVGESPELFAQAEHVLACALRREGDLEAALNHHDRSLRICRTVGSVTAERILAEKWERITATRATDEAMSCRDAAAVRQEATRYALQAVAAIIAHSDRSSIVADEVLHLIRASGFGDNARMVTENQPDAMRAEGAIDDCPASTSKKREDHLQVGKAKESVVGLFLDPKDDVSARATLNAIRILVNAVNEIVRDRAEREERATLWPVEELPVESDKSVISGHMRELMTHTRRIATTKVNVLITGESGTGKEILARAIHDFSDRAKKPFVPFNCTAVPRDLLESHLFGHRRGAFTGADRDYIGLIRSAREGTLFLDEVGELSLDLQPKLLRFLESGEIATLGEPNPLRVDVRIVAATNADLEMAVREGKFREDLFYRLNVVRLSLRPLRERRDEIPNFVSHFVTQAAAEYGKGHLTVAEETMERLLLYRWPGNVRQLHNEIRRIVAFAEPHSVIGPDAIADEILGALPVFRRPAMNGTELSVSLQQKLLPTLAHIECEMIKSALSRHHGKATAAAKDLGISRKGLYLKRQRFGLC